MQLCPIHSILFDSRCRACTAEYQGVLQASGLTIARPSRVEDIHDLPGTDGPLCEATIAHAGSAHSEITCVRPARHEGDCEDLHGLLWDHDDTCGCFDD